MIFRVTERKESLDLHQYAPTLNSTGANGNLSASHMDGAKDTIGFPT